jgi:hypothetical protein
MTQALRPALGEMLDRYDEARCLAGSRGPTKLRRSTPSSSRQSG